MTTRVAGTCLRLALRRELPGRTSRIPHIQGRSQATLAFPPGKPRWQVYEPSPYPRRKEITWHNTRIRVGEEKVSLSSIYLRDRCTCSLCVDPSSKQRNFLTSDIPGNIEGRVIESDTETFTIEWTYDIEGFGPEHRTTLPFTILDTIIPRDPDINSAHTAKPWAAEDFRKKCKDVSFEDYMHSDEALHGVLNQLKSFGLAFITNVPESEEHVSKIAERIGPVKNTLYGFTWDVRSVPEALNVAYTSKDLGFHMDLLPMKYSPQLQFLHCIRSSAKGGNSLFTDAHAAAQILWREDRRAYLTLQDVQITFHYDHPETHLYRKRVSVFNTPFKTQGDARMSEYPDKIPFSQINWSPPFQGPIHIPHLHPRTVQHYEKVGRLMAEWRDAAAKFNEILHRENGIYERLMRPGECVIFANTRVLHARTAFDVDDAGKERWLRGCYVDGDAWLSKEKVLNRRLGQGVKA